MSAFKRVEMGQQDGSVVEELGAKTDNLSSIPGTSPPHPMITTQMPSWYIHTLTQTQIDTYNNNKVMF